MKRLVIYVVGLALLVVAGCRDSLSDTLPGSAVLNANEVELHIGLHVPGSFQSGLRAISDDDESAIRSINVLAFKVDPGMEPAFMYSKPGTLYGANKDTLVVVAETKYDTLQQFVVIANADAEIIELLQTDRRGVSKSNLLAQLKVSLNEGELWNVDETTFKALPMWGESVPAVITKETGSIHGIEGDDDSPIELLRMVARINVKVTDIALVLNKFKLDSVYLFNSNAAGLIVPDTANVGRNANGEVCVTAPSIPPGLEMKRGKDAYVVYPASNDLLMENTIYTFESDAVAHTAQDKATCVVIGGRFNGSVTITYYRVDFVNSSDNYFPLLRNYQYNINIKDVTGAGYDTVEEAFGAKSVSFITTNITTPWETETQDEELDL